MNLRQNQANNNENNGIYTYTLMNKVKKNPTKIKYSRLSQQRKQIKEYIYQLRAN